MPTLSIFRSLLSSLSKGSKRPPSAPATAAIPVPTLSPEQYEAYTPIVVVRDGAVEVTYCTPNRMTKMRADTLFSKEPDTIAWILGFEAAERRPGRSRRGFTAAPQSFSARRLLPYVRGVGRLQSAGTRLHSLFTRVATMEYRPNSLFAFFKTDRSFHGVERITDSNVERDLLLYDVRVHPVPAVENAKAPGLGARLLRHVLRLKPEVPRK